MDGRCSIPVSQTRDYAVQGRTYNELMLPFMRYIKKQEGSHEKTV